MMKSIILKQQIKGLLENFSDNAYQLREWKKEQTYFFPSEFTSQWFDDAVHFIDVSLKKREIEQWEWDIIQPFSDFFKQHLNDISSSKFDRNPELLLDYQPWIKIQQMALDILQELNSKGWDSIESYK